VIEDVRMSSSLASRPVPLQDVGVSIHWDRRRFTAAFKLKIIEEAARCVEPGALGALLRREGLYSSHLAAWRAAAKPGALSGPARRAHGGLGGPPKIQALRGFVWVNLEGIQVRGSGGSVQVRIFKWR